MRCVLEANGFGMIFEKLGKINLTGQAENDESEEDVMGTSRKHV